MSGTGTPDHSAVAGGGMRLGIVVTRWHSQFTEQMLTRARDAARASGVTDVTVAHVEGSAELSVVAQALARRSDAVVALGAVIRGGTPHFEYVCDAVTAGLTRVALDEGVPVAHGVLTCDTEPQARDRAGFPESAEDKGWHATIAALDAAVTLRGLRDHG